MAKINTSIEKTKYFYLINKVPPPLSIKILPLRANSITGSYL